MKSIIIISALLLTACEEYKIETTVIDLPAYDGNQPVRSYDETVTGNIGL